MSEQRQNLVTDGGRSGVLFGLSLRRGDTDTNGHAFADAHANTESHGAPEPSSCPAVSAQFSLTLDQADLFNLDSTAHLPAAASLAAAGIISKKACLAACTAMYPPPRAGGKTDKGCQDLCNKSFPRGCPTLTFLCQSLAGNRSCYNKYEACTDLFAWFCVNGD